MGNPPRLKRPVPRGSSWKAGKALRRDSHRSPPHVCDLRLACCVPVRPPQHAPRQDLNNGTLPEKGQAKLLHWFEEGLDDWFLGFPEGKQPVPALVEIAVEYAGVTLDGGTRERLRRDANRIGQTQ